MQYYIGSLSQGRLSPGSLRNRNSPRFPGEPGFPGPPEAFLISNKLPLHPELSKMPRILNFHVSSAPVPPSAPEEWPSASRFNSSSSADSDDSQNNQWAQWDRFNANSRRDTDQRLAEVQRDGSPQVVLSPLTSPEVSESSGSSQPDALPEDIIDEAVAPRRGSRDRRPAPPVTDTFDREAEAGVAEACSSTCLTHLSVTLNRQRYGGGF